MVRTTDLREGGAWREQSSMNEKKGKERDRTLVRVAGGVVENRERKGGGDSGGERLREAQTERRW